MTAGLLGLSLFAWGCATSKPTAKFSPILNGFEQTDVFVSGQDGYAIYRIPSLVVTKPGTLLAIVEGRKKNRSDTGDIDILVKRSADGGRTWSAQQVIWDDGGNTCGNPCAVVDEDTGTIWLLLTHNLGTDKESAIHSNTAGGTRTVWVCSSRDDGRTWTQPQNITATAKASDWGWYATGPGVGIQIKNGPHRGRLVIPCDHSNQEAGDQHGSHAIYSDDHGLTWQRSAAIRPKVNECQAVELADKPGRLLMDMRSYFGEARRTHAWSEDGGATWTGPASQPTLVEPICQASILRYTWPDAVERSRIVFCNPADEKKRTNLTFRVSYDEAKTWPVEKTLPGHAAYSCLAAFPDATLGCLYETGVKHASEKITLVRFTLPWLTDGKDGR